MQWSFEVHTPMPSVQSLRDLMGLIGLTRGWSRGMFLLNHSTPEGHEQMWDAVQEKLEELSHV